MMYYICHRVREIRIYFLEKQIWNSVSWATQRSTTQSGVNCKRQQCVWNAIFNVTLLRDRSGNTCSCETHTLNFHGWS